MMHSRRRRLTTAVPILKLAYWTRLHDRIGGSSRYSAQNTLRDHPHGVICATDDAIMFPQEGVAGRIGHALEVRDQSGTEER